jgi:arylsulfatase/arylsulfatase A
MIDETGPNVLLVVLDSVRAANVSVLGYRRETTPYLGGLASETRVYSQARTPGTWSLPAHISLFTGRSVPDHDVHVVDRLDTGHTVFEALAGQGYDTGVFSSNVYITDHPVDVGAAFETVVGVPETVPEGHAVTGGFEMDHPDGFWYADRFLSWVDGDGDDSGHDGRDPDTPFAACVNVMDAHRPYLPRAEYDTWGDEDARAVQREIGRGQFVWKFYGGRYPTWYLRALERLYDGAIRQADAVLERVVEGLRDRGVLKDTLLVVTADHGDGLGEPSAVPGGPDSIAHTLGCHERLTHVPLFVRSPTGTDGDSETGTGTGTVDRLATLSQFPAAVERTLDADLGFGGRNDETPHFVAPRGEVLTYRRPIDGPKVDAARDFCGSSYERYVAPSQALYRDGNGRAVEKVETWGEAAVRVTVYGSRATVTEGSADPGTVDRAVADVRREGDDLSLPRENDPEKLDEGVKRHLENIGYL